MAFSFALRLAKPPRVEGAETAVAEDKENEFVDFLYDLNIPVMTLGHITKGEIRIDDQSLGFVDKGIVG